MAAVLRKLYAEARKMVKSFENVNDKPIHYKIQLL